MRARLAIVGSVTMPSPDCWAQVERVARVAIEWLEPACVISGGADGVDSLAERIAGDYGMFEGNGRLIVHRPTLGRWEGSGGYRERNLRVAHDCTHLLALRSCSSRTYGSGWTADRAEELGRTVWRRYFPLDAATAARLTSHPRGVSSASR